MINSKSKPTILEANILYLLIGVLLITLGSIVQAIDIYKGLLITEYIIILLPILLFLKKKRYSIKETLRLNRVSLKQIIYTIMIVILSYPIAVFLNYIGIIFLSKYGQVLPNSVPMPTSLAEFILGIVVISIAPGICEEAMFRGMILKAYEPLGSKKAIIYSAVLFGIFHFNLQNLLGPTFLGLLFGILAYKTNSIIPSVIGHMTNNFIALLIGFYSNKVGELEKGALANLPEEQILIYGAIVMGIVAVILGSLVYRLIKSIPPSKEPQLEKVPYGQMVEGIEDEIYRIRNMDLIESFPLLLLMIIFLFFNYRIFFVLV